MSDKDGGPAFPRPKWWPTDGDPDQDGFPQGGMSLRDYFAGQALASLDTAPLFDRQDWLDTRAEYCYKQADAMLRARAKAGE